MYVSDLFRKMMAYGRSLKPNRMFILSAKYGLLLPDDIIEPYEQTLNTMKKADREAWAAKVLSALRRNCDLDEDEFVFLAGQSYRKHLVPHIRHCAVPMQGMAFGRQLEWLGKQAL